MAAAPTAPMVTLNDGRSMPQLGLGVLFAPPEETAAICRTALAAGYRSIDTATIYRNEEGVGAGVRASGLPRDEVFVTTKLWNADQGYDEALAAFDASLARLGFDEVDLYLIHWPCPKRGRYLDSWRALVRLREEGRARSIGVSNFQPEHLERIIGETGVVPAVNQIQLHPAYQQHPLRAVHATLGIVTESWSPLGQGRQLENPEIARIAARHGKSPAQVIIRWHIESGLVVIPKSANAARIAQNLDVFDFSLDAADMAAIGALDAPDGWFGPDPNEFN